MTTDDTRALLTLAAKAAGIAMYNPETELMLVGEAPEHWNPITSSADCGELEARLMICVVWSNERVGVSADFPKLLLDAEDYSDHGGDRQAARRMAVTRLAAKIGGGMVG